MTTKEYRKAQTAGLLKDKSEYNPCIKIMSPDNAQTNYMDITRKELKQIISILTK